MESEKTVAIKVNHMLVLVFVLGILIGAFGGYYFAGQKTVGSGYQAPIGGGTGAAGTGGTGTVGGGGSAAGTAGTAGGTAGASNDVDTFIKYASDLKLDANKFTSCLNGGKYASQVGADYSLGTKLAVSGTPTFVVNGQRLVGAQPYDAFKTAFDAEIANPSNRSTALGYVTNDDPTRGKKDAPVVVLEFSDFQCPFCQRFWKDTLSSIDKDYVQTGKVLFVYKDFPLSSIHPHAQKAAEAGQCAAEQGKFWEYHDKLFGNQAEWAR